MGTERLVVEAAVARLWQVFPTRMFYWRREGRFDSDEKVRAHHGYTHYYRISTLDRLHSHWARGFPPGIAVPTAEELLAFNGNGLQTRDETLRATSTTRRQVEQGISERRLPLLEITERILRFPAVAFASAFFSNKGFVSQEAARRVLMLEGTRAIDALVRANLLERVLKQGMREWQVDYNSLLALLQKQVRGELAVEAWWQRNLADARPPLSVLRMSQLHHVAAETINTEVNKGRLPAMQTSGGATLIPQWAIDEFNEHRRVWPVEKVAALLGVRAGVAADFIARRALCDMRHGEKNRCPSTRCLRGYITANRTDDSITANEWFARSMRDCATPILDIDLLAQTAGVGMPHIREAIIDSTLRGVYLPPVGGDKRIALVRADVVVWQRMQERMLRNKYE